MRLLFTDEVFKAIALRCAKEEITEDGIPINYKVNSSEGIMLDLNGEKVVFLSENVDPAVEHIRHFMQGKENPGVIIISDRPYLHSGELTNKLLLHKILKPRNIVYLGQHIFTKAEHLFLTQNKLYLFPMKEITHEGHMEVCNAAMSIAKNWSHTYVLIDSSILDSTVISTNWAGGMTFRDLIFFIQRIKRLKNFESAELIIPPAAKKLILKLVTELYIQ